MTSLKFKVGDKIYIDVNEWENIHKTWGGYTQPSIEFLKTNKSYVIKRYRYTSPTYGEMYEVEGTNAAYPSSIFIKAKKYLFDKELNKILKGIYETI